MVRARIEIPLKFLWLELKLTSSRVQNRRDCYLTMPGWPETSILVLLIDMVSTYMYKPCGQHISYGSCTDRNTIEIFVAGIKADIITSPKPSRLLSNYAWLARNVHFSAV